MYAGKNPFFISDLHLSAHTPALNQRFIEFLQHTAQEADALFILGDLFGYWSGDDAPADPWLQAITQALQQCSRQRPLWLMHGNRDCLLGPAYALEIGATLLPDPSLINLQGHSILLAHGDALCTDDVRYQALRQQLRNPEWQAAFLARPLADRLADIARIQAASAADKQQKSAAIMDVNPDAVVSLLDHYGSQYLVHGHTHRPGIHDIPVNRQPAWRVVLPDWNTDRGGYLRWQHGQPVLVLWDSSAIVNELQK